jgi:hypothetical protein
MMIIGADYHPGFNKLPGAPLIRVSLRMSGSRQSWNARDHGEVRTLVRRTGPMRGKRSEWPLQVKGVRSRSVDLGVGAVTHSFAKKRE